MSFIILPKNTDKTAVLVEQNKDVVIDSSIPVEVNVQQPVSIDEPVSIEYTPENTSEDLHSYSMTIELMQEMVLQLRILNKYMSVGHDEEFTESDLEEH